jgi:hypothetical protein
MSRGTDRTDAREPLPEGVGRPDRDAAPRATPARVRPPRPRDPVAREPRTALPVGRWRAVLRDGTTAYRLRQSESRTLETLATFRVVLERDLAEGVYDGSWQRLAEDVRSLREQGLVQRRGLVVSRRGGTQGVLALTPAGQQLLERHQGPSELTDGRPSRPETPVWGKRADLVHNACLYRMYRLEAARLAADGARVRRVSLDDDLKRALYRDLQENGPLPAAACQTRLAELAVEHHLPIVNGHVQLPDLRLDYESAAGERGRVDLELATDHYRAGQIRAKQQAGFSVYRAGGDGSLHLAGTGSAGGASSMSDPSYLSGLLSL